jgi:hypothetical protein
MDEEQIIKLLDQYGFEHIIEHYNMTEVDILVALDESGYIDLSEFEEET